MRILSGSSFEISDNGLNSISAGLLDVVGEASTLVSGKSNVRTTIVGKKEKLANNGGVVPLFIEGRSIRIGAKSNWRSRCVVR